MSSHQPSLLDQVRHIIRLMHYSIGTGEAYLYIIKRFIIFRVSAVRAKWARPTFVSTSPSWQTTDRFSHRPGFGTRPLALCARLRVVFLLQRLDAGRGHHPMQSQKSLKN